MVSLAPRLSANVGRTGEQHEHGSIKRRTDRNWPLHASGSFGSCWGPLRARESSRAAARCRVSRRSAGRLAALAVGEMGVVAGPFGGGSITAASSSHVVAPLARRRVRGVSRAANGRGRRPRVGQRRHQHVVERRAHAGLGIGRERRADVTNGRGQRSCHHRAAWRLIRSVVAPSRRYVDPDTVRQWSHSVG